MIIEVDGEKIFEGNISKLKLILQILNKGMIYPYLNENTFLLN